MLQTSNQVDYQKFVKNTYAKQFDQCWDCKSTNIRLDHGEGKKVCISCGFVLESNFIDLTAEWRNFSENSSGMDPNRVGGVLNTDLKSGGLGIRIGGEFKDIERFLYDKSERNYNNALKTLSEWGLKMDIEKSILERAQSLFQQVNEDKRLKNKNKDIILATTLLIASRQDRNPIPMKEFEINTGFSKYDMNKLFRIIKQIIPSELSTKPSDFINSICSKFNVSQQFKDVSRDIADKIFDLTEFNGRNPRNIAATAIMIARNCLQEIKPTLRQVSNESDIADGTIRSFYRDIIKQRDFILPQQYYDTSLPNQLQID